MPDDLAKYLDSNSAVGKRFRGHIDGGQDKKNYLVNIVFPTTMQVSYSAEIKRKFIIVKRVEHAQDRRVYFRKRALHEFSPRLDEVDSPFSIVRD